MHTLRDIIPLPQRQPASNRRPRRRRPLRIQRIDIKTQMNRRVRTNMRERELHYPSNPMAIDVMHAERADAVLAQDLLLAAVDIAQPDVHEFRHADALLRGDPVEDALFVGLGEARDEGDGHAVNVTGVRGLGRVDVGMGVDPDDPHFAAVEALADGSGGSRDGADRDAVVAAEGEDEAALAGLGVDLLAEGGGDGGDGAGVLHAAVVRVGGGEEGGEVVDGRVAVEGVAELGG